LDNYRVNCYDVGMKSSPPKAARPARRFDSPEQEAFLNLWRTYDRLRQFEDELFGRYELTPQQYNALRLLRGRHPGRLPTLTLAAKLVSRAPDITRLLDKLAEGGLIDRERPAEDRRAVHVGITAKGLELLARLDREVRTCHRRQLGHLSAAELRTLIDLLERARRPHELVDSDWR
jgi:DNA-binding MarR family transcriptional regulator